MGKIAFLFAGQGAQKPGMGKDLYEKDDNAKKIFEMGESLRSGTSAQCFNSDMETLTKTENTQPCLFLMDLACARALEGYGVKADMAAGFSLGEIPALGFTGILSDEEAFRLVMCRGSKMLECSEKHPGSMMAVLRLPAETIETLCRDNPDIYAVNFNCPGQTVIAGKKESMEAFVQTVQEAGGRTIPLKVSGAFHTPFMQEAADTLALYLKNLNINASNIPLISNMTSTSYPNDRSEIERLISCQLANSVHFEASIRYMYEHGVDTFVEVGAGTTLTGLVRKILDNVSTYNVYDMESLLSVVTELKGKGLADA